MAISSFSSSETILAETMRPVLEVILAVFMPLPPRRWSRYALSAVLFPKPFSVMIKRYPFFAISRFFATMSIPTSSSPFLIRIPVTPAALRPIGLMSFSLNRIAWPRDVIRTTSSSPLENFTHFKISSLFNLMAIRPLRLTEAKSSTGVFLIIPFFVAITKCLKIFSVVFP
ncbi:MAG: hypothetical protein UX55_C0013G0012 [Candidatus Azambacteria bacterium GW2011_GWE2_46_45]|uniref:Uncharacterized protein n=2 Tax=Candidatus Azamiibacteriota TaxID=1752741 RepID=A0A0G1Q5R9_9BACT|nr:MAG: hypothetical protein UX27_C0035G0006 [Candidatus Azambacteria bacterium GW2011_GWA2_45_90]KKU40157.1 MAG: hypothetical protein UX55_C0013G0012 [Candidatus Azambacteria bacterium GW2011_GWE2_46_45]